LLLSQALILEFLEIPMLSVGSAYALVKAKFHFAQAGGLFFSMDVGRAYAQQGNSLNVFL